MLSVILPTYNEFLNVEDMVLQCRENISPTDEIIIVDDDSPDGTADLVRDLQKKDPHLKLVVRKKDHGLTASIQKGIEESKGDIIIWLDCDLSQPPNKIPELVKQIEAGFDIAVASRYVKGGRDLRAKSLSLTVSIQLVLSYILRLITSLTLSLKFADWSSGYIAVKRKVILQLLPLQGNYGEYFIYLIYNAIKGNYSIKEVPYSLIPREFGESKTATNVWGLVRRGVVYLYTVIKLRLGG